MSNEASFNFELQRIKRAVEGQVFVTMPNNIKTLDEFDEWLSNTAT